MTEWQGQTGVNGRHEKGEQITPHLLLTGRHRQTHYGFWWGWCVGHTPTHCCVDLFPRNESFMVEGNINLFDWMPVSIVLEGKCQNHTSRYSHDKASAEKLSLIYFTISSPWLLAPVPAYTDWIHSIAHSIPIPYLLRVEDTQRTWSPILRGSHLGGRGGKQTKDQCPVPW